MMTISRLTLVASVALATLAVPSMVQGQATATVCKDGTTSAVSGRGACSGHGGVNAAATKAEKKAVKSEEKTAAKAAKATGAKVMVTCGDGTTSTAAGRGACSGHGGVKAAAASKAAAAPVAAAPAAAAPAAAKAAEHAKGAAAAATHSGAAEDNNPAGAMAKCKDGMYSHAATRRGACSRHGGVAQWMAK